GQMRHVLAAGDAFVLPALALVRHGVQLAHVHIQQVTNTAAVMHQFSTHTSSKEKGPVSRPSRLLPDAYQAPVAVKSRTAPSVDSWPTTRVTSVRICHCSLSPTFASWVDWNERSWPSFTLS